MKKFYILSPPPNVTGNLHIGHSFTFTIQDFIVRLQRDFNGKEACLLPGYDHGGLSTEKSAKNKLNLSKNKAEAFEQIKTFAKESKKNIGHQFEKLKLSMDFNYEKYTLDPDHSNFVENTFIDLYNKGLITKKLGIINFDTALKSPVSDLEITRKNIQSKIYNLEYKTDKGINLVVATTRPETIFADMALCVNPNDSRYKELVGTFAYVPIIQRKIPIIADEYVDKDFGSGVLKITPAHDINDFNLWKKHFKQENIINIIEESGKINLNSLENQEKLSSYNNLSVLEARELIVKNLSLSHEEISQNIPVGEKSGGLIEYLMSEQWFFNVSKASKMALKNIDKINIYPNLWFNTYKSWLENIHEEWCISRTSIWGHSIPVYYKDNEISVQKESPGEQWTKSTEILDTWFSSALWPLSYKREFGIYPTNVLVTAYDIIFFWVARMVMMSLLIDNSIPFHNVYLHRLVTDKEGKKMSKTRGNVVNPLEIIEEYGVDTLRYSLLNTLSPCGKIFLSEAHMKEAKKIITKFQNFTKYLQLEHSENEFCSDSQEIYNYYCNYMHEQEKFIEENLNKYNLHLIFDCINKTLYEICSWLLEFSKVYKSLIPLLKKIHNNLQVLLSTIMPESFESKEKYQKFAPKPTTQFTENLKHVIHKIRSYNKLGIKVGGTNLKKVFLMLGYAKPVQSSEFTIDIMGYSFVLSEIKQEVLQREIEKNQKQIETIDKFLEESNEHTPEDIIESRKKTKIFHEKLIDELKSIGSLCQKI